MSMKDYLSIIVTNGEDEWQYQGLAVPRVGEGISVRKDGAGDLVFGGTVEEVHWELREGSAGMVVTVWLTKD